MTLSKALSSTHKSLSVLTPDQAYTTVQELVAAAMEIDVSELRLASPEQELTPSQSQTLNTLVNRAQAGEPLAYILGHTEFFSLPIKVTPQVLIPRPETEELVQLALDQMPPRPESWRILEVGVGSGCIACAISHTLTQRRQSHTYIGIDISAEALRVATENIERNLGKTNPVQLLNTPLASLTPDHTFDLLISNPPYITDAEYSELDMSVKSYEPALALKGGEDGLSVYREIYDFVHKLAVKPQLFLEISPTIADKVAKLFAPFYTHVKIHQDSFAKERFLSATN